MLIKIGKILQSRKAPQKEVKEAYSSVYDNVNKCVHCGSVIPEGRLSCKDCESEVDAE